MVHRDELLALIAVRSTQTNEVGRCTALLPALGDHRRRLSRRPAAVAPRPRDIGGSEPALRLLRLHLPPTLGRRHPRGRSGRRAGPSRVCGPGRVGRPPSTASPAHRGQDGDRRPPDRSHLRRRRRLVAGLPVARQPAALRPPARCIVDRPHHRRSAHRLPGRHHRGPARRRRGHRHRRAAGRLPFLGGGLPRAPSGRANSSRPLRQLSRARPLHYLYAEAPIETPGLPTPPSPSPGSTSHLATALVHVAPDGSAPVRLADMHHHGKWLQWWATPKDPTVRHDGPAPAPPRR